VVSASTGECWCTDESEAQCQRRIQNTRVERTNRCPPEP
jgi:hypothetical protein